MCANRCVSGARRNDTSFRSAARLHENQPKNKSVLFKVNSTFSCRLYLLLASYLCHGRGIHASLQPKQKHPVCIPKREKKKNPIENFSNDLRHDKQNANVGLIKCTTFPCRDQFSGPCPNTKPAYVQLLCPDARFQNFSEHKPFTALARFGET